jgi:hypothetical protein
MTRQRLGITDIILCETLQGIHDDLQFARVRDAMLSYEIFQMCGTDLALAAAENYRALRARGITVRKTIDCLIATFCLQNGHTLLHSDKDFESFEQVLGLPVIRF